MSNENATSPDDIVGLYDKYGRSYECRRSSASAQRSRMERKYSRVYVIVGPESTATGAEISDEVAAREVKLAAMRANRKPAAPKYGVAQYDSYAFVSGAASWSVPECFQYATKKDAAHMLRIVRSNWKRADYWKAKIVSLPFESR